MRTINIGEVTVFDNPEPTKEQALKILEEAAEVVEAFKEWDKEYNNLSHPESKLKDEIADVIQSCANLIAALGVDDFTGRMEICKKINIARGRITVEEPEPELKPCPFCGGEAEIKKAEVEGFYNVTCKNTCGMCSSKRLYASKEEAIAIWNRRVVDTDELESVADELNVDFFLPDETYSCTVSTEETLKFEREMAARIRKAVGL